METYKTIQEHSQFELTIKKSRFITSIYRIKSEDEAKTIIAEIKKEHFKANHSCFAMILGEKSQLKRSSDDGEPSGTAGLPILTVLEKLELTNILVLVTRYFGGIKLGTGGLIRAYSSATSEALKSAQLIEVKEQAGFRISLSYSQYQQFSQFLELEGLEENEREFTEQILSSIYFDPDREKEVEDSLIDFYKGKITFTKLDPKVIEVPLK
ncbi:YigZ family protein [Streptococcus catagoni]|uniref:YigZ family protein n=1 Tax=Streptococcus catagoni TaxID=2654874 RepID=UPI00140C42D4|nr:YigZ family protein [Streptococcus catagoni]